MPRRAVSALAAGSNSRRLSKKVMPPQFSIAPPKPPGTAIRSSLGSGYLLAEIVVVVGKQLDRVLQRKAPLLSLAFGGDHADGDAAGIGRDAFELARGEHEQIARHFRRRRECDPLLAGCRPAPRFATGMLLTARKSCGTVTVSAKLALNAGSSQQGKMRRASAGSSWLEIIRLMPPSVG